MENAELGIIWKSGKNKNVSETMAQLVLLKKEILHMIEISVVLIKIVYTMCIIL